MSAWIAAWCVAVERGAQAVHVEPDLLAVALDVRAAERLLVLEEHVVHLPELLAAALRQRLTRGDGRRHGVLVEGQHVVAPDDAHVVAVLVHDAGERGLDPLAERALELAPHHDGDERVVRPALRRPSGHLGPEPLDAFRRRCARARRALARAAAGVHRDGGELAVAGGASADQVADGQTCDEGDQNRDDRRTLTHDMPLYGNRRGDGCFFLGSSARRRRTSGPGGPSARTLDDG
jgi:hypothetical protein